MGRIFLVFFQLERLFCRVCEIPKLNFLGRFLPRKIFWGSWAGLQIPSPQQIPNPKQNPKFSSLAPTQFLWARIFPLGLLWTADGPRRARDRRFQHLKVLRGRNRPRINARSSRSACPAPGGERKPTVATRRPQEKVRISEIWPNGDPIWGPTL